MGAPGESPGAPSSPDPADPASVTEDLPRRHRPV